MKFSFLALLAALSAALACESAPSPVDANGNPDGQLYRLILQDLTTEAPIHVYPRLLKIDSDFEGMPRGFDEGHFVADLPPSLVRSLPESVEVCNVVETKPCDTGGSGRVVRFSLPVDQGANRVEVGASLSYSAPEGSFSGRVLVYTFGRDRSSGWTLLDKRARYFWD